MFIDTTFLTDGEIRLTLTRTANADPEKGYVPAYHFIIERISDGAAVGNCDLRVGHNGGTEFGGNIGYAVMPQYRGNRYATKACKLLFELAKKHDMGYVIITCATDNTASQKTCEGSGAEFLGIVDVPQWHDLSKRGDGKSCIYKMTL